MNIRVVVHKTLQGHHSNTSLRTSHSATNKNSKRPGDSSSHEEIEPILVSVVALEVSKVLEAVSFGARHILLSSNGNPGV